jgi:alpha-galactosidase/6-phospho-beta-glucosidase family protein
VLNYCLQMPKVTLVGAGSAVFARQLITDILAIDGLDGGTSIRTGRTVTN